MNRPNSFLSLFILASLGTLAAQEAVRYPAASETVTLVRSANLRIASTGTGKSKFVGLKDLIARLESQPRAGPACFQKKQ